MKIIITALILSTTFMAQAAEARQPTSLLPKRIAFEEVERKIENLRLTGCFLDQGDEIAFIRVKQVRYAVNRKTFAKLYRETRDIDTTLIALDAGDELCRVNRS